MPFLKKKLDTILYWKKKVDYLFSDEWGKFAEFWKSQGGEIFNGVDEELYLKHFRAISLQIIGIIISRKNVNRDKRYQLLRMQEECLSEKNAGDIAQLYSKYNALFGSSFEDGVRPMAEYFAHSLSSLKSTEMEDYIYETMYLMINEMLNELKAYKLV